MMAGEERSVHISRLGWCSAYGSSAAVSSTSATSTATDTCHRWYNLNVVKARAEAMRIATKAAVVTVIVRCGEVVTSQYTDHTTHTNTA